MSKISVLTTVILVIIGPFSFSQSGMVDRSGGGQYFNAEQYKIDRMKMQTAELSKPTSQKSYETPTDFSKPKKGLRSDGEIWIDGYCRFRPASYSNSRYCSEMSETMYLSAKYPATIQRFTDNFSGSGNILWDNVDEKNYPDKTGYSHIADSLKEGIPLTFFQHLLRHSDYFKPTQPGGEYEFSRAWKVWVKRVSGPENMPLEIRTQYDFTNGDDNSNLEISDNGSFEIWDNCNNCEHSRNDLKKGKAKSWITGGWNEITISKDELNTVKILVNDELLVQYQIPNMPITTRYSSFFVDLSGQWQKKNLMFNIGEVTVESYPKNIN